MKKIQSFVFLFLVFSLFASGASVWAASKNYVYRSRANWVKLVKLSNKQLAGVELKHPASGLAIDQINAMLQSLHMTKGAFFKKEVTSNEIFTTEEAVKYAPLIARALSQAQPNQIVNLGIVHKRPYFILRHDYISIINVFVADDGIHFNFSKLFAKLQGDYQQASNVDEQIQKAKSIRVSLEAHKGQTILSDQDEVILDLNYDFAGDVMLANTHEETANQTKAQQKAAKKKSLADTVVAQTTPTPTGSADDVKSRLETLEQLKKDKLITNAEYQQKKSEILNLL